MKEDRRLVEKAKKGDRNAFGELYDKYLSPIYRFLLVKVNSKTDAEDLAHQTFLSAWQNLPQYKFQGLPFSSWLYRIAHNAVIDFYRKSRRHLDIESVPEDFISETPDIALKLDAAMQYNLVKEALAELEPEHQNVLILRFINDLSHKDIAAILAKSEGAVRVIQHRALKQVKKIIGNNEPRRDYPAIKEI